MNKISMCCLSALLFSAFGHAAAPTVTVTVTGQIVPGTCTPVVDTGNISYGNVNPAALSKTNPNYLGVKSFNINVSCDVPVVYALSAADNRTGTATTFSDPTLGVNASDSGSVFGLGKNSANENIGQYSMKFKQTTVDGVAGNVGSASSLTGVYTAGASIIKNQTSQNWIAANVSASNSPLASTQATFPVDLQAIIRPLNELTQQQFTLDGNATITLNYI